ncbi:MAG: amino acid ABC transporter ATP-binding protein, partial [Actinobacteria bacterium]|nr:amino acid ABC transporter ATP-binding protein [Actinomycetota bacterium]
MSTPVLRVEKLRKSFGKEIVLQDITFSVPEHTATVFIGASGSGKSTLLRCINLLEQVDDGVIRLDGSDISAANVNPDEVRKKLGMVFQAFNLFPHMTVLENIILAPTKVQGIGEEEAVAEAFKLLERFGLKDKADQYPDRLSGGQQQRVAIIRSLARHPRLLLLDEITSALDP